MSIWTHCSGVIRLDRGFFEKVDIKKLNKIFISSTYEKPNKKCNMPCGSEGSVQFQIIKNNDETCINNGQIFFWGDLRCYDFKDAKKEFKPWLEKVINKLRENDFLIRDLIFKVSAEDDAYHIIFYIDDYDGKLRKTIV